MILEADDPRFRLCVVDDGPGLACPQIEALARRGVRATDGSVR